LISVWISKLTGTGPTHGHVLEKLRNVIRARAPLVETALGRIVNRLGIKCSHRRLVGCMLKSQRSGSEVGGFVSQPSQTDGLQRLCSSLEHARKAKLLDGNSLNRFGTWSLAGLVSKC